MKTTFGPAILLGLLVAAWMFAMGFLGWYKDPRLAVLFMLVVPIEIVVLVFTLRATADRTYGRQVARGVLVAALAGLVIFSASIVFTTVAFPTYFEDIRKPPKPVANAFAGFVGTVVTGLVSSLVIAIFARRKCDT